MGKQSYSSTLLSYHTAHIFNDRYTKVKLNQKQPCKSKHAYINENGKWVCACGKKLEQ